MKIAFFTDRMKNGFGVDLVVKEQAKLLSRKHQVTVYAINIDDDFDYEQNQFEIRRLNIPLSFNPIKQDLFSFRYFKKYEEQLKNYDAFIIHTPTFHTWLGKLNKYGSTYVFYHGNSPSEHYKGLKKYRCSILHYLDNIHLKKAKLIFSPSNFLMTQLKENLQKKTIVIPHGASHITSSLKSISSVEKNMIFKKYYITKEDKLITYIGRLDFANNPYKNTNVLFDIQNLLFSIKNQESKNLRLFAIGFPENDIEREMYNAGISVLPLATESELVTILSRSYLFISPSSWEGFNLPLIEAQALGVPVVALNTAAHPEVVGKSSGILVDSLKGFKTKVIELILDNERRDSMSKEAKLFADKFTWERSVAELEKYL